MASNKFASLTDEQLLTKAKDMKVSPTVDALIIGFLFGIIIFSVVGNGISWLTLIPILLISVFLKKSKDYKAIHAQLQERELQTR